MVDGSLNGIDYLEDNWASSTESSNMHTFWLSNFTLKSVVSKYTYQS